MEKEPSIKATAFLSAAEDVLRHVELGDLPKKELDAKLRPQDRPFLDKGLSATSWVPIETYRRVMEVLIEVEAPSDVPAYLHGRGVRAAERMHQAGLYRQFRASPETWGLRVGEIAVTMAKLMYNFTTWTFEATQGQPGFRIL